MRGFQISHLPRTWKKVIKPSRMGVVVRPMKHFLHHVGVSLLEDSPPMVVLLVASIQNHQTKSGVPSNNAPPPARVFFIGEKGGGPEAEGSARLLGGVPGLRLHVAAAERGLAAPRASPCPVFVAFFFPPPLCLFVAFLVVAVLLLLFCCLFVAAFCSRLFGAGALFFRAPFWGQPDMLQHEGFWSEGGSLLVSWILGVCTAPCYCTCIPMQQRRPTS